jgi:hypothetical protein
VPAEWYADGPNLNDVDITATEEVGLGDLFLLDEGGTNRPETV